ncbi:MAG TPA: hypothetical protein VFO57_03685 [Burkholderiales bacterium]|nr:hypothetical protein [Burkholderiales bacterium]
MSLEAPPAGNHVTNSATIKGTTKSFTAEDAKKGVLRDRKDAEGAKEDGTTSRQGRKGREEINKKKGAETAPRSFLGTSPEGKTFRKPCSGNATLGAFPSRPSGFAVDLIFISFAIRSASLASFVSRSTFSFAPSASFVTRRIVQ